MGHGTYVAVMSCEYWLCNTPFLRARRTDSSCVANACAKISDIPSLHLLETTAVVRSFSY